jgi:protein SCO1/2
VSETESRGYWAKRLALRVAVLIFGLALVTVVGRAMEKRREPPPLQVLGRVPAFQLTDQSGAPFTDGSMAGHVNVVDFIFTRCVASCPRLTAHMSELQGRFTRTGSGARLVSFSVDPENDTPAVLADYAKRNGADPARWSFVTGPVDGVKTAVVSGFKVALEKLPKGANDYDVTHGDWFVLVDGSGNIRGYYTTDQPADVERLARDVSRLERGES